MKERFVVITTGPQGQIYGRTRIAESRVEAVRFIDEARCDKPISELTRIRFRLFLEGAPIEPDGIWSVTPMAHDNDAENWGGIYGRILPVTD